MSSPLTLPKFFLTVIHRFLLKFFLLFFSLCRSQQFGTWFAWLQVSGGGGGCRPRRRRQEAARLRGRPRTRAEGENRHRCRFTNSQSRHGQGTTVFVNDAYVWPILYYTLLPFSMLGKEKRVGRMYVEYVVAMDRPVPFRHALADNFMIGLTSKLEKYYWWISWFTHWCVEWCFEDVNKTDMNIW